MPLFPVTGATPDGARPPYGIEKRLGTPRPPLKSGREFVSIIYMCKQVSPRIVLILRIVDLNPERYPWRIHCYVGLYIITFRNFRLLFNQNQRRHQLFRNVKQ